MADPPREGRRWRAPLGGNGGAGGRSGAQRGAQTIDTVTLRKPIVRDLRGLAINALYTADVDAMAKLLPRITTPTLLAHEIDTMAPADFTALATEVVGFLLSKQDRAALPA